MKLMKLAVFSICIFSAFIFYSCKKPDYTAFCEQTDEYLESSKFQGTVLVAKGKDIIYCKGFGPEDEKAKKPSMNGPDSVYEIGSITKQMTAACILKLEEENKLSLSETLEPYFPEFPFAKDITIEMLLNMRSGLLDHINAPDEFFGPKLAKYISKKELAGKNIDRDQVFISLCKAPLLTKPDSTYFYSNTNYYLLAMIIEAVSGMSYEDYMEENIFEKAGMTDANLLFQETSTRGYYKNRYYSIAKNMAVGCGDVNASAMDLYNWNSALAGNKVIGKKTFEKMISSDSYGYGVYRTEYSILHSGATYVFNSYNEYFLKDKISFIVLVNKPQSELNATIVAGKIKKLFFADENSEIKQ